jgi:predicted RNA-binding Zn ribbon-like protein
VLLVKPHLVETIETIPFDGGHIALDFVNTVDGDPTAQQRADFLRGYDDLLVWSRRAGVISARAASRLRQAGGTQEAHARALALRAALDGTFRAIAEGAAPPPTDLETVRLAALDALGHARLVAVGDRYEWRWPTPVEPASVLWPVAHEAAGLLTSPELARVKRCGECLWLFLDASRNRSRRWCNMENCGTSVKKRRYVQRRAARRRAR